MDTIDAAWIAGLLEGEGTFGYHSGHLRVTCEMTDEDVIERLAKIIGSSVWESKQRNVNWKPTWRCSVSGERAKQLMLDIYPMMGSRRQGKIDEVVHLWDSRTTNRKKRYNSEDISNAFKDGASTAKVIEDFGCSKTTALRYKRAALA